MIFTKEQLQEKLWESPDVLVNKLTYSSRWSLSYDFVFTHEDKIYRTYYQTGATEMQDEEPWEFEDEGVECVEVEPYEITTTGYRAKKA